MSRRKRRRNKKQNIWQEIAGIIALICILIFGYVNAEKINDNKENNKENTVAKQEETFDLSTIPEYTSEPYVEINNNQPDFSKEEHKTEAFEKYSEWDSLGRSGVAYANIC